MPTATAKQDVEALKSLLEEGLKTNQSNFLCYLFNKVALTPGRTLMPFRREVLARLTDYFTSRNSLQLDEVDNFRLISGLRNISGAESEERAFLRSIVTLISRHPVPPNQMVSLKDAVVSVYGLRQLRSADSVVRNLLSTLEARIAHCEEGGRLDGQGVGMLLNGLQGLSTDHEEVPALIKAVSRIIRVSECGELNARSLSMLMFGLQNLRSDVPEVSELLVTITPLIRRCGGIVLTASQASLCLTGLRRMSSAHTEVRDLVEALLPLLKRAEGSLSDKEAGLMMLGMRGLSGEEPVVRDLIPLVAHLLSTCIDAPTGTGAAMLVAGLRCISGESRQEKDLIIEVARLLALCQRVDMRMFNATMMMKGLHRLSSRQAETQELVREVARLLSHCKETPTGDDVGSMLNGFHGMASEDDGVDALASALAAIIERATSNSGSRVSLDSVGLSLAVYGLQSCAVPEGGPGVLRLVRSVTSLLQIAKASGPTLDVRSAAQMVYG